MNIRIIITILAIFMFSFVSSFCQLESVKLGENVTLRQTCGTCSYVNISVYDPLGNRDVSNVAMTNVGGGYWEYNFTEVDSLGKYDYPTCGDIDGSSDPICSDYENLPCFRVTPTGSTEITEGQGDIAFISMLSILGAAVFFFFLFTQTNSSAWKVILLGTSGLMLMISVLYSMVLMDQNLGTFESLVKSYGSFWFVIKVIVALSMLGLLLYALYRSFIMWQIKRGFRDE